jgi:hypothetical protein
MRPFRASCATHAFSLFYVDLFNLMARFHFYYRPNIDARVLFDGARLVRLRVLSDCVRASDASAAAGAATCHTTAVAHRQVS